MVGSKKISDGVGERRRVNSNTHTCDEAEIRRDVGDSFPGSLYVWVEVLGDNGGALVMARLLLK